MHATRWSPKPQNPPQSLRVLTKQQPIAMHLRSEQTHAETDSHECEGFVRGLEPMTARACHGRPRVRQFLNRCWSCSPRLLKPSRLCLRFPLVCSDVNSSALHILPPAARLDAFEDEHTFSPPRILAPGLPQTPPSPHHGRRDKRDYYHNPRIKSSLRQVRPFTPPQRAVSVSSYSLTSTAA